MTQQAKGVRRVVTGTSPEGESVLVSDETVEPMTIALMPGAGFAYLWGAEEPPTFPTDGSEPPYRSWFPGAEGYRFEVITIPPDTASAKPAGVDPTTAIAEVQEKLPGLLESMDRDHPGLHRTDTVDLVYIISGQCVLHLDGGDDVTLGPGDTAVQNGTRHAWKVPFEAPCTMLCVSIGGARKG